jgi:cystathionine gamma-synthase
MTLHRESLAVTSGRPSEPGAPLNAPIVPASTYRAGGELVYGRDGNPSWSSLEHAIGELEGGRSVAFSSGVAAAAAVLATVPPGGVVVAPRVQYHGIALQLTNLSQQGRIDYRPVDLTDHRETEQALDNAALVWGESPSNPILEVIDLGWLSERAHQAGAVLVVDSTLATPLGQQPLSLGADVVLHSATKFVGGHSDLLLGLVVTNRADLHESVIGHRHDQGSVPGALESFLALRGLRTLAVRLAHAEATAATLSERLSQHPAVLRVHYPGLSQHPQHELAGRQMSSFGAMVSFEAVGDPSAVDRTCSSFRLLVHGTSLGGVETMIERRAKYPGDRDQGVPETLLRMSVGLEHVEDLWEDLNQALQGLTT